MMNFRKIILSTLLVSLVLSIPAVAGDESGSAGIAGKPSDAKYPFVAEVTANNVFIRSKNNILSYHTGKAAKGDRVTVVGESTAWAKIVPPAGSYSWVHKNYVDVDSATPTEGVVNGDNVRVWAGSDYMEPLRSNSEQMRLRKWDPVELFADQPETGDYYKVKPPAGAHLWISVEYLRYVGDEQTTPAIPPRPKVEPEDMTPTEQPKAVKLSNLQDQPGETAETAEPVKTPAAEEQEAAEPVKPAPKEFEYTQKCHQLAEQIDAELKKPVTGQDYSTIRKELEAIIKEPNIGKAATYAKILTERIDRYELAISVTRKLEQQDQKLEQAKKQIEKAHQKKLENLPKELNYLYVGLLKPSHIYTGNAGQKRYLLMDDGGKILCYVTASNASTAAQLEELADSTVGIRGDIVSDYKSLVTLIAATTVEAMAQPQQ